MKLQHALSESDLHNLELSAQLLEAKAQLQRETAKRKKAEKKVRICRKRADMVTSELELTGERERRRLAQDLHDTVAQNLAACRYKLETLQANKVSGSDVA